MEVVIVVPQEGTSELIFEPVMEGIVKVVQNMDVCKEELDMPLSQTKSMLTGYIQSTCLNNRRRASIADCGRALSPAAGGMGAIGLWLHGKIIPQARVFQCAVFEQSVGCAGGASELLGSATATLAVFVVCSHFRPSCLCRGHLSLQSQEATEAQAEFFSRSPF